MSDTIAVTVASTTPVTVEVINTPAPPAVVTVTNLNQAIDVIPPPPPNVVVTLPPPAVPPVVDVTAAPPTVAVAVTSPPVPVAVSVQAPLAEIVDVIVPSLAPVVVEALAAWQAGVPDAPVNSIPYVRRNNAWIPEHVTSVARKTGDVLLYSHDLEDWDTQIIDGGNF